MKIEKQKRQKTKYQRKFFNELATFTNNSTAFLIGLSPITFDLTKENHWFHEKISRGSVLKSEEKEANAAEIKTAAFDIELKTDCW